MWLLNGDDGVDDDDNGIIVGFVVFDVSVIVAVDEAVEVVENDKLLCTRDKESKWRTRDVNESRFGFGKGELFIILCGDGVDFDEIGIEDDELRLLVFNPPVNELSLILLCADSGLLGLDDDDVSLKRFKDGGPDFPYKFPVLRLNDLFDTGP